MLIDGEKWACEACVRGHRVSSCHHSDRHLTHINKKGRPVTQCPHCRGLRKSRTTHAMCECGDKKKNCHNKNDWDSHAVEKRDSKQEPRQRCSCAHGQRCICALKKEPQLDPVPETGLPPAPPALLSELKRPHPLTSTKSESTLTIFRDGHHKPAHKHNDMAHKCGVPYTIPRSNTIHSTFSVAPRSVDHLPSAQMSIEENHSHRVEHFTNMAQRQASSEHGSPDSTHLTASEDTTTSVPSLEPSSLVSSASPPHEPSNDGPAGRTPFTNTLDSIPRERVVPSVPPLDVSLPTFPAATTSPTTCISFRDSNEEYYLASSDPDFSLRSAALNAPPVDWSSFPLYSTDVPAATNTQAPSYASLEFSGLPAPSSSGDVSELDEIGPFPGFGSGGSDLHDEGSDFDPFPFSSTSVGLPQAQLLSSSILASLNIDDFLKSTNESTAALEQQLQVNMGMESKSSSTQDTHETPETETFKASPFPTTMATSPVNSAWSASLIESVPTSGEEEFLPHAWA